MTPLVILLGHLFKEGKLHDFMHPKNNHHKIAIIESISERDSSPKNEN